MSQETKDALQKAQEEQAALNVKIETLAKQLSLEEGSEMVIVCHQGKTYKMTRAGADIFAKEIHELHQKLCGEQTESKANQAKPEKIAKAADWVRKHW